MSERISKTEGALGAFLVAEQIDVSYDGREDVLHGVSFSVCPGEFVGVIGPSGSGKSTLLKSLNLLVRPRSGRVLFSGEDLCTVSSAALRRARSQIGFIFQDYNLIEESTVLENVLLGQIYRDSFWKIFLTRYSDREVEQAMQNLERTGLAQKAFAKARDLSGGQKQRVAIARTLLQSPKIILADEPVSSLDRASCEAVMEDFLRINRTLGIPIVINLHDVALARAYCSRLVGLKAGRVLFSCAKEALREDDLDALYRGA